MELYFMNAREDRRGNHEVHEKDCHRLPSLSLLKYLGEFEDCHQALIRAKEINTKADGCYHCCGPCHTA